MIKTLDYIVTVGGVPRICTQIGVSVDYKSTVARASFVTTDADVSWLNQVVNIHIGYSGNLVSVFSGYVDAVAYTRLPHLYEISCSDILKLAEKHFIVTENLEEPWSRSNISAEDLVRDLLSEAGLTNYNGQASAFTFGTQHPVEFNTIAVIDAISQIKNIIAYDLYALNGVIYFNDTRPIPGTVTETITKVISWDYEYNTNNLRNKVVVFGRDSIYAETSVVSPYLPVDFYQTAIVSSELINTQSMADSSAAYNLDLYNRLGEQLKVEIEGNANINCRDTVHITLNGIDCAWFVYSIKHTMNETFTTELHLRK